MSEELASCPFCGGEASFSEWRYDHGWERYVHCLECGARGPECDNREDAIAAWNRRAPVPPALGSATIQRFAPVPAPDADDDARRTLR